MPNPFYLRGPEFLVFYAVFGVIVVAAVAALRRRPESPPRTAPPLTDYLRIAYLRGGAGEAIRVATLALIDRGLLRVVNSEHLHAVSGAIPAGLLRTEQRLLEACAEPVRGGKILDDRSLQVTATTECEAYLARTGLLPDSTVRAGRIRLIILAWLVLGGVALLKILIALSAGRTNIGFLVITCLIFGYIIYAVVTPFRTAAGDAMLGDLRTLFEGLRDRAIGITMPSGGNDAALLAAVFGMGVLPGGYTLRTMMERWQHQSSSASACGSGSSCGSSCGGGCGGGGCGGCGS